MKCYYEILEISREADDSEIKTAYRKLALKWHPDKNIETPEEAKEQFQLVQQAYEVLSDRQERAWYDKHREQILKGSNSDFKDDSLDVYQYFTTQCFKGYGDDENGFYTVYRKVFENISDEDIEHMDSKSDYDEIPIFGTSSSDYNDIVGPFYAYWSSYTTKKSYVWLDPYNIKEATNGRILKLIEKENKKIRQKAKKERNDEVRNLVAFVRKRDKRVQAHAKILEARNAENRAKHEELRKQKILENKRERHNSKSQAEWSKFDNVKKELKDIEKHLAAEFGESISNSDESLSEDESNLYCVACNKVFKTPKAFANHESSKKHRENVEILKQSMLDEENAQNIEETSSEESDINDLYCVVCNKEFKTPKAFANHKSSKKHLENVEIVIQSTIAQDNSFDDSEINDLYCLVCKKEFKTLDELVSHENTETHLENLILDENINSESSYENTDGESDSEMNKTGTKKKKKSKKVIRNTKLSTGDNEFDKENLLSSDEEFDFGVTKKTKKKTKQKIDNSNKIETKENELEKKSSDNNLEGSTKKSKKKTKQENGAENAGEKRRVKKSLKKNLATVINSSDIADLDLTHCCVICKSNFPSKNKLFEHLKKTGHSIALPEKVVKNKKKTK